MKIILSENELKIILSSITWILYATFYLSVRPEFTQAEQDRLQAIFEQACHFLHDAKGGLNAHIDGSGLVVRDVRIASQSEVAHLVLCLHSFYREVGHSGAEVAAVTGVPVAQFDNLLARISGSSLE